MCVWVGEELVGGAVGDVIALPKTRSHPIYRRHTFHASGSGRKGTKLAHILYGLVASITLALLCGFS